jgi:glycosyltransferase involved in cell wall biosynthesis
LLFRHALQSADALICPSRFAADYIRDNFAPRTMPLHVIGSGVDIVGRPGAAARSDSHPLHLACVGAVVNFKGVHVVLEALRLAGLPEVRLSLFGFRIEPYFRRLVAIAETIDGLDFHAYGAFDRPELPILLGDVDLVIVPSIEYETYSMVAHEAMACGIPVVASRLGALPEAIRHGENGLLFEPGSAAELASILHTLDTERDRLDALRAGIRRDDWISLPERTSRLEGVLDEVLSREKGVTAATTEFEELSILRDALLEPSAA